jgi:hypothetical protein
MHFHRGKRQIDCRANDNGAMMNGGFGAASALFPSSKNPFRFNHEKHGIHGNGSMVLVDGSSPDEPRPSNYFIRDHPWLNLIPFRFRVFGVFRGGLGSDGSG